MYKTRFFCIIFTLIFAVSMTIHTAEAAEPLTLSTSTDIYYSGDYVVVFGHVETIFGDTPVIIRVHYNTNLIDVAQIEVAEDGTYAKSFYASGSQWENEGTYQISAKYSTEFAEKTFEFFSEVVDKSSATFPVNIPNSGTFDVGYTIRGGEVESIIMHQGDDYEERYSILIGTTMNSNGNLILKLPRESFDAQHDSEDVTFIVMISKDDGVDGVDLHHTATRLNYEQVEYEEIATSSDYRTIRIPLEKGDQWVEVIGTYIIPEFGSIAIIILVVAVSSAIIISKSKFSIKYN